jgi:epoxide hydrolase-like predicted phosphatase
MASEDGRPEYRGLLVDYGGVLTTSPFGSFAEFCAQEGVPFEALTRTLRTDPRCRKLLIALETGRMANEEFESDLAAILGVPAHDLIARMFAGSRPDPAMAAAVRAVRRAGIGTALVSNSWGTGGYDRGLLKELFDAVVISGEVEIRKPSPEIYALAAQRIEVAPRQCVFIDDLDFNLAPAVKLGMAAIHHVNTEETIAELERLLGLELRQAAGLGENGRGGAVDRA